MPVSLIARMFWFCCSGLMLIISTGATQDLVTRDDFVFYDTTTPHLQEALWPSVAFDNQHRVHESYYVSLDTGTIPHDREFFVYTTDNQGNQVLPTTRILPYTGPGDTVYVPRGWHPFTCNFAGEALIPYSNANILGFRIGANGNVHEHPIRVNCEDTLSSLTYESDAAGDINNQNVVALTWAATYGLVVNRIPVRLYYPEPDTLSAIIWAHEAPLTPMPGLEQLNWITQAPQIAVADDGRFVVSWIARNNDYMKILYVVFNADGTPATDIQLAECIGVDPFDPQACPRDWPNYLSLTMESDGDFYMIWFGALHNHIPGYEAAWHLWVRGFNADGSPKYDAMIVNDADSLFNTNVLMIPQITCNDSGYVVACWSDSRLHPKSSWGRLYYDVYVQKIDANGELIGHNVRVNNSHGNSGIFGTHYSVALDLAGQTVMAWRDEFSPYDIYAQLMPYHDIGLFVPGDINYDLSANVTDITDLVAYLFQGAKNVFWPRNLIDINGDSANGNVADLTYLVEYVFGGGPTPFTPDPGPRPPIDPPVLDKNLVPVQPAVAQPVPEEIIRRHRLR